ncbi:MAG TPA: class I SAM-dependent methyltransferase [Phycisphaerae bacterium]|nr:class I SAM-dependent methyltransferase [Phycisphaerae bacterium]
MLDDKLAGRSLNDVYSGWERYYQQTTRDTAWLDRPDSRVVELVRRIKTTNSQSVLDLGCGDGRNAQPWLLAATNVVCVDVAPTALARCIENADRHAAIRPVALMADMTDLQLADSQFDVIQCIDALPHVADPKRALEEMARVARKGAEILFNLYTPEDCAFGLGERIDARSYIYKHTLFRFWDREDLNTLIPDAMRLCEVSRHHWEEAPHPPFRESQHEHDSLFIRCTL